MAARKKTPTGRKKGDKPDETPKRRKTAGARRGGGGKGRTAKPATGRRGRPSKHTHALERRIFDKMVNHGWTLRRLERETWSPSRVTIWRWREAIEGFEVRYQRARRGLLEYWADELLDIADDNTRDEREVEDKDGNTVTLVDHEHINRARLRVDSRKWLIGKLHPEFNEALILKGDPSKPVTFTDLVKQATKKEEEAA